VDVEIVADDVLKEKDAFTINDDGSLSGPPGGMVPRLTKKKA
jgi:hypothetical protein